MFRQIGKLLQMNEFSDFQIICQRKVFHVNRNILACSSNVFHPMLTNDTLEKRTGKMTIEDMEPDSVEELLNYIYTGRVENLVPEWKAMDLFVAADRFVTMSMLTEE